MSGASIAPDGEHAVGQSGAAPGGGDPTPPASTLGGPRQFAGLPLPLVGVVVALFALALWNIWTTHELVRLRSHRMVSVSLERLVRDFVASQARSGIDGDRTAVMTKLYLAATESAVKELTKDGTTVLISEAVMGQSVPDLTSQVQTAVAGKMQALAGSAGAMPPALATGPRPAEPSDQPGVSPVP